MYKKNAGSLKQSGMKQEGDRRGERERERESKETACVETSINSLGVEMSSLGRREER